jgi:pimeloyl-ACP methyl ester carboxylesterase
MKHHFFGNPQSQLFGVHHRPRGIAAKPSRAVLICPPIGQEYIRTHWCLRLMANQLCRNGAHVLRMDYSGMGDSAGSLQDVQSLDQWTRDVLTGIKRVKELSGAGTVMLVGLRMGAMLAARAARHSKDVNSLVLWEPIEDGESYLEELRAMHRRMLDLWVCKMKTPNDELVEEILGSRYSRSLIESISESKNDFSTVVQPQLIVVPEQPVVNFVHVEPSIQNVVRVDEEYNWNDLRSLETAWLRSQTARQIVDLTKAMFERLNDFNALASPALVAAPTIDQGSVESVSSATGVTK